MPRQNSKKTQLRMSKELEAEARMVTTKFRASYEHVVEPWSGDEKKDRRYSVQMIFPKSDPFIRKAKGVVKKIAIEAFGDNAVKLLRSGKLHNPFRDGDDEFPDDETYQGNVFVNANGAFEGKKPPGLFSGRLKDMRRKAKDDPDFDLSEYFYSGCYAAAEIKFYPYDRDGGRGVACYLWRVQKQADGEPLGGGKPVDAVFDEVEEDTMDMDNDDREDDDDVF